MKEAFWGGKEFKEDKEGISIWGLLKEVEETKDLPKEPNDVMKAVDFKNFMGKGESQALDLSHRVWLSQLEERDLYNNGEATKPQMEMIKDKLDTNKFGLYFKKYYLDSDPADIKGLQKCLNKMIDGYKPDGRGGFEYVWWNAIIRVHDEFNGKKYKRKWLHTFLEEQQLSYPNSKLSLEDWDGKSGHIREDGKFGPQTYAVLLFFKSEYLKERSSSVRGNVRSTGGNIGSRDSKTDFWPLPNKWKKKPVGITYF